MRLIRAFLLLVALVGSVVPTMACDDDDDAVGSPTLPPTLVPPPSTTLSPTSGPPDFIRPAQGYRFSYPENWFYHGSPPGLPTADRSHESIGSRQSTEPVEYPGPPTMEATIHVSAVRNSRNLSLNDWLTESIGPANRVLERRELVVGGQPAVELTTTPGTEGSVNPIIVYVAHDEWLYSILLRLGSNEALPLHRPAFDQVLATFRFIR